MRFPARLPTPLEPKSLSSRDPPGRSASAQAIGAALLKQPAPWAGQEEGSSGKIWAPVSCLSPWLPRGRSDPTRNVQHLERCSSHRSPGTSPPSPARPVLGPLGAGNPDRHGGTREPGPDVGVPLFWALIRPNMLHEITVSSLGLFPDSQKFDP